jgi:hypothetical protein
MPSISTAAEIAQNEVAQYAGQVEKMKNTANDIAVNRYEQAVNRRQVWTKMLQASHNKDREIQIEGASAARGLLSKISY